jgi:protoporphyrinogen oxidase
MRRAEVEEVLRGSFEARDDNHYYANEMRYPEKGGYFEFIRSLAENSNYELNKKVVSIDTTKKEISFSDGTKELYKKLVSSLPIPVICRLIKDCPEDVLKASQSLVWTTVDLISIGFDRENIPPYLWYYIYDDENIAARAYSPSLKSRDNAPKGKSSLQFEVYNLSTNPRLDPEVIKRNILDSLIDGNICQEEDILFVHHKHLPFGNVVFDHGMEERREIVLNYLNDISIKTCGRFGEWDYYWSDQSFISGMNSIDDK